MTIFSRSLLFGSLCFLTFSFGNLYGESSSDTISLAESLTFLDIAPGTLMDLFRIRDGGIQIFQNAEWVAFNLPYKDDSALRSQLSTLNSAEGIFVLGAPAVIKKEIEIDFSEINPNHNLIAGSASCGAMVIAVEDRIDVKGTILPRYTFYSGPHADKKLGTVILTENPYNFYMDKISNLTGDVTAVELRSSKNPYDSLLFFYNTKSRSTVGSTEFSLIQYLPLQDALWLVDPVARCDNMMEILSAYRKAAKIVPIFQKNEISKALSDHSLFLDSPAK